MSLAQGVPLLYPKCNVIVCQKLLFSKIHTPTSVFVCSSFVLNYQDAQGNRDLMLKVIRFSEG